MMALINSYLEKNQLVRKKTHSFIVFSWNPEENQLKWFQRTFENLLSDLKTSWPSYTSQNRGVRVEEKTFLPVLTEIHGKDIGSQIVSYCLRLC